MFEFLGFKKNKDKVKVLIVDDEPNIVRTLKDRLEMNEYDVITGSNGQEGLERAIKDQPDIILLDVIMPLMDGLEMLEALRRRPECSGMAVIMLTARRQTQDIARAKS